MCLKNLTKLLIWLQTALVWKCLRTLFMLIHTKYTLNLLSLGLWKALHALTYLEISCGRRGQAKCPRLKRPEDWTAQGRSTYQVLDVWKTNITTKAWNEQLASHLNLPAFARAPRRPERLNAEVPVGGNVAVVATLELVYSALDGAGGSTQTILVPINYGWDENIPMCVCKFVHVFNP